ncbi:MAG TPA: hypothetical protein VGD65_18395 [Chryseosolibacter sp.]
MKISLYHIALVICLAATAGLTAVQAQDNVNQEYEITDSDRERYERDRIIFSPGGEGETRYVSPRTEPTGSSSPAPKDTVNTSSRTNSTAKPAPVLPTGRKEIPGKNPTKQIPPKQDDDAILTFNFLYYIIQKYKLQEIIE